MIYESISRPLFSAAAACGTAAAQNRRRRRFLPRWYFHYPKCFILTNKGPLV